MSFQPLQTIDSSTLYPTPQHPTLISRLSRHCTQLLYHPLYTLFILVLFVLQLTLLIWGLVHHKFFTDINVEDTEYVVIDIIVVVLITIETCIRIMSTYQTYFKSMINIIFDIGVLLLIVITLSLYTTTPEDALLSTLLQVVRSSVQLIRCILVLQHHKQRNKMMMASDSNIDFQQLNIIRTSNINDCVYTLPDHQSNQFSHIINPTYTIDTDNNEHNISHVYDISPVVNSNRSDSDLSNHSESISLISMNVQPVTNTATSTHQQFLPA